MAKPSQPELTTLDRLILYTAVTLTGAAVMMLEILGTRVIGPFYGTSLVVWAALIAVALTALALGYFAGGWLADRSNRFRLPQAILLAALTTSLVPLLARPVLLATDHLGMRLGALTAALLLFGAPLTLLAMAGPLVIHLACSRGEEVGMSSGSVYAVSTLGSVAGTLLLGFYLLPVAGSHAIIAGLSLTLWLLALVLAWYEAKRLGHPLRPAWLVVVALLLAAALAGSGRAREGSSPHRLLFHGESIYGRIQVVDDLRQGVRWMLADASIIGGEHLASGRGVLAYQEVVREAVRVFHVHARKALLIGLGAGHLVRDFNSQG